ncbi:EAL domain-containing protein [Halomonas campisalis]|uniref:EAL domain-containing protein n=1 Tax=Billgrantia campisalis TaxID=74661 RepID=A0ABS9P4J6_9GAMM|nr:EAL domain-containing protein [Halomonas campisalis]MCG6656695.1 EAL domain-containing protein [Halomonas campisalis]MDR5861884.1 EAL domain-containing protein [Halomonas campisalis]
MPGNTEAEPATCHQERSAGDTSNYPRHMGVEYQPIINTKNDREHGYEALARFWNEAQQLVPPDKVFGQLHHDASLLLEVEEKAKRMQVAHAPAHGQLFLNLDPHAYHSGNSRYETLFRHLQSRPHVVVELIENSNHSEGLLSERLAARLAKAKLEIAVDDLGAEGSMVSFPVLMAAKYIKLDRSWMLRRNDDAYITLLETLIDYARRSNKWTVLEGIESEADLGFARQLGVDFVQGFLYRERFSLIRPAHQECGNPMLTHRPTQPELCPYE